MLNLIQKANQNAKEIKEFKARKPSLRSSVANYKSNIRSSFYGLWAGHFDVAYYMDSITPAIQNGLKRAWYQGASECGISASELTSLEIEKMNAFINDEVLYALDIGFEIRNNSKANGGKWTQFQRRTDMWANRYMEVHDAAMAMACRDQKLKWVWNPIKEHCTDCMLLNGRVYRASIWEKYDIRPRMRSLACHGFKCGCSFVQTNEPATPGRPPMIGGL